MSEEKCDANSKETCEIVVSEPYKPEDQEKQIIRNSLKGFFWQPLFTICAIAIVNGLLKHFQTSKNKKSIFHQSLVKIFYGDQKLNFLSYLFFILLVVGE